jgi:hypothetical protein
MKSDACARWFALTMFAVGLTAACPSSERDKACAFNERGFCGQGQWCKNEGNWSQCVPLPADRKACQKERWPGECSGSPVGDGGSEVGATGQDGPAAAGGAGGAGGAGSGTGGTGGAGGGGGGSMDGPSGADGGDARPDTTVPQPDAPQEVQTPAVDTPPACTSACSPVGRAECVTGGVRSCVMMPNGCAGWGQPEACPTPQACPAGETKCSCPTGSNACTREGDKKCGSGGVQTCTKAGACFAWTQPEACASPQSCAGNAPNAKCECPKSNACSPEGAAKCGPGGGVQTCKSNGSACLSWSAEQACDYHGCESGKCATACPASAPVDTGSKCEVRGASGQQCCAQKTCGPNLHCNPSFVCKPCGGFNQECCGPSLSCQTGLVCFAGQSGPPGRCATPCGGAAQRCCSSSESPEPCEQPGFCSGDMCR